MSVLVTLLCAGVTEAKLRSLHAEFSHKMRELNKPSGHRAEKKTMTFYEQLALLTRLRHATRHDQQPQSVAVDFSYQCDDRQ